MPLVAGTARHSGDNSAVSIPISYLCFPLLIVRFATIYKKGGKNCQKVTPVIIVIASIDIIVTSITVHKLLYGLYVLYTFCAFILRDCELNKNKRKNSKRNLEIFFYIIVCLYIIVGPRTRYGSNN